MAKPATDTPVVRRPRKDPSQKATTALEKAQKDYDKANTRLAKLEGQLDEAEAEVARTQRYLDFAKANPDLPEQETSEPAPEVDGTNAAE